MQHNISWKNKVKKNMCSLINCIKTEEEIVVRSHKLEIKDNSLQNYI